MKIPVCLFFLEFVQFIVVFFIDIVALEVKISVPFSPFDSPQCHEEGSCVCQGSNEESLCLRSSCLASPGQAAGCPPHAAPAPSSWRGVVDGVTVNSPTTWRPSPAGSGRRARV